MSNIQPISFFLVGLTYRTAVCGPACTVVWEGRGREVSISAKIRIDLVFNRSDHFDLTSTRGTGSAERFGRFRFQAGELVLADAGYCHPAGIAAVIAAKADVCVRFNPHALPIFDEKEKPFPLLKRLEKLRKAGDLAQWPIRIKAGDTWIVGRVCAIAKARTLLFAPSDGSSIRSRQAKQ